MKNKIGKNGSKKLRRLFLRSALITLACVAVAFGGVIITGRSLFDAVQINADYEEYQPKQKRNTEEDKEKELERLGKEKKRLEGEIKRVEGKLSNKGFTEKAPAAVVEEERQKGEKYKAMLKTVIESIDQLR